MKAIAGHRYGSPDGLRLEEVDKPAIDADGVLVKILAASVNPFDWHSMRGLPYFIRVTSGLRRPKRSIRGLDMAGRVEAVGANVTEFRPGDEVFGLCDCALAEYACGAEQDLVLKPAGLTFEQAAAVPMAGFSALQAVRSQGQLQAGQTVLINGASGGVGTFAVQIAKALGAEVTGVCSTRNVEMVASIGADYVVDYTVDDFARSGKHYDLIIDAVGNRSLSDLRGALTSKGILVLCGGGDTGKRLLGPLVQPLVAMAMSRFVSQSLVLLMAKPGKEHLVALKELIETGKVMPVLDRTYELSEAPEAIRHLETGHARGKVVITMTAAAAAGQ
jgi:NADPH:quinone reductase-like Zn-dependent oxidoreductase